MQAMIIFVTVPWKTKPDCIPNMALSITQSTSTVMFLCRLVANEFDELLFVLSMVKL